MKRFALLLALAAASLWAQESHQPATGHENTSHEAASHESAGHDQGDPLLPAKWLNFGILAAGLGYAAIKFGGPALRGQQAAILDQLNSASKRAEAAAAEAAEIDRKVSGLGAEVSIIRQKAEAEMAVEVQRFEAETAQMLAKLQQAADLEIASAAKHAREQIKATVTQLALNLAVQKLRTQITPATQSALVARFVGQLKNSPGANQPGTRN
jgi:F0F1-type ATP synthase membrane subunit b/b'